MQRWLPLVALVVLGALAVVLWQHDPGPPVEVEIPAPSVAVEVPNSRRPTLKLVEDLPRAEVRVRVTAREDARPLPGIRVRAWTPMEPKAPRQIESDRETVGSSSRTDADGLAILEVALGAKLLLSASPTIRGAMPESVTIDPPLAVDEVRDIAVTIPTRPDTDTKLDLVLHGRVIDRESRSPIHGARVGRSIDLNALSSASEVVTDADGRFRLDAPSWDGAAFGVLKAGYEPAVFQVVAGFDKPDFAFEIALAHVARVRVTALDDAGDPIVGAVVKLETHDFLFARTEPSELMYTGWTGKATFDAVTDANGVAVLLDLPPRVALDGVLMRGRDELMRAPERLVLAPREERTVTWRIGSACTIDGVALETDGRPAAALTICLERADSPRARYFDSTSTVQRRFARTDGRGRFAFEDVGVGTWWVGPSPKRRVPHPKLEPLDAAARAAFVVVPPETSRVDLAIRVHRGLSIQGRVLDPTGEAVGHAYLTCTPLGDRVSVEWPMQAAEGRFVVGPIEEGEYELTAAETGFVASVPIRVRSGATNVELRLRTGGKLRGRVVDEEGRPTAAHVSLRARAPATNDMRVRTLESGGVFELDGIEPGVYDVVASTAIGHVGLARDVAIQAGSAHEVRVQVGRGARVRIRNEGEMACHFSVLVADTIVANDFIREGCDAVFAFPAGPVVVRVSRIPERTDLDLSLVLTVGETRDVVFDGAWK